MIIKGFFTIANQSSMVKTEEVSTDGWCSSNRTSFWLEIKVFMARSMPNGDVVYLVIVRYKIAFYVSRLMLALSFRFILFY